MKKDLFGAHNNCGKKSQLVSIILLAAILLSTGCSATQDNNARDSNGRLNFESLQRTIGSNYIVSAASGVFHSLALTNDGRVFGTGYTHSGALGFNDGKKYCEWVYTGLDNVSAIACGNYFSLALRKINGGQVWVTGNNGYGQLAKPADVYTLYTWTQTESSNVTAIAAGDEFSLCLYNGIVYATGRNQTGQLGLGDNMDRYGWTATSADRAIAIAAGNEHALCIRNMPKANGQVWATGRNDYGQLAVGDLNNRNIWEGTPSANVTAIAAGYFHSVCLCTGTVCVSGAKEAIGLGDIQPGKYWTNTQQHGVSSIACGNFFSSFIRNGRVYAAGMNQDGQLGLDDKEDRAVFTGTNSGGVNAITAGYSHSFYISNGRIYGTGRNTSGLLGIGNYISPDFWTLCP